MPTKTKKPTKTGSLKIGNQWNAISIIAQSQTHPLKAVCELVENAIDSGSKNVHIVRRRRQGRVHLELLDDGKGIVLDKDGAPDFDYIATHICDSMKRRLEEREREGVHGEFGIGLLSFWSLGEELRMTSATNEGQLREMCLQRGDRNYTVRPVRGLMATVGTRVVVGPLLTATRNIVTGEKLQRYLSAELRDRIRNTGVKIRITDRISRKDLMVTPREFEGERLHEAKPVTTHFGELAVELYVRLAESRGEAHVAICKDGTRVLPRITDLIPFQHSPWTDGRLEGVLDFPALSLAPGTRSGIVPDEHMDAFVAAVRSLEPTVIAAMESLDQAESDKASRQILRQLQRAFVAALRVLPAHDYNFFDLPENGSSNGHTSSNEKGLKVTGHEDRPSVAEDLPIALDFEAGPLAVVTITPSHPRRRPGDECLLSAKAFDENGIPIANGVEFNWRLTEGNGALVAVEGSRCRVTSAAVGVVTIEVVAAQQQLRAESAVDVKFLENTGQDDNSTQGLPSYSLEAEHGRPWRSRYDSEKNEIVINSVHRDFLASRSSAAKHRRYVGKLYAKEVVLLNFPHESGAEAMERLIEMLVHTEDVL
ncbi:MAG: ATP-binding protein [Planctomycetes bacterium]|nr:ATP-binding protein [Planctomycetota bacterium]